MSVVKWRALVLPDIDLFCKVIAIRPCDIVSGVVKMTKGIEEKA